MKTLIIVPLTIIDKHSDCVEDPNHFQRLVDAMEKHDPEGKIAHQIAAKYQKEEGD